MKETAKNSFSAIVTFMDKKIQNISDEFDKLSKSFHKKSNKLEEKYHCIVHPENQAAYFSGKPNEKEIYFFCKECLPAFNNLNIATNPEN
jgi:hypothetical protein